MSKPKNPIRKELNKILREQYSTPTLTLLEEATFGDDVVGICKDCKEVCDNCEPDLDNGYCDYCGKLQVISILMLNGLI